MKDGNLDISIDSYDSDDSKKFANHRKLTIVSDAVYEDISVSGYHEYNINIIEENQESDRSKISWFQHWFNELRFKFYTSFINTKAKKNVLNDLILFNKTINDYKLSFRLLSRDSFKIIMSFFVFIIFSYSILSLVFKMSHDFSIGFIIAFCLLFLLIVITEIKSIFKELFLFKYSIKNNNKITKKNFHKNNRLLQLFYFIYSINYCIHNSDSEKKFRVNFIIYDDLFKSSSKYKDLANYIFQQVVQHSNLSITIQINSPEFIEQIREIYQAILEKEPDHFIKNQVQLILKPSLRYDVRGGEYIIPEKGFISQKYMPVHSETHRAILRAKEIVKENHRIIQRLSSELNHEIRNPLGIIQMIADNLLNIKSIEPEKRGKYLRDVINQANRASQVLDRFKKYYGQNKKIFQIQMLIL